MEWDVIYCGEAKDSLSIRREHFGLKPLGGAPTSPELLADRCRPSQSANNVLGLSVDGRVPPRLGQEAFWRRDKGACEKPSSQHSGSAVFLKLYWQKLTQPRLFAAKGRRSSLGRTCAGLHIFHSGRPMRNDAGANKSAAAPTRQIKGKSRDERGRASHSDAPRPIRFDSVFRACPRFRAHFQPNVDARSLQTWRLRRNSIVKNLN